MTQQGYRSLCRAIWWAADLSTHRDAEDECHTGPCEREAKHSRVVREVSRRLVDNAARDDLEISGIAWFQSAVPSRGDQRFRGMRLLGMNDTSKVLMSNLGRQLAAEEGSYPPQRPISTVTSDARGPKLVPST
jgi:hypothetical protein